MRLADRIPWLEKAHDVSGEPRVPAGSPEGGEWTASGKPFRFDRGPARHKKVAEHVQRAIDKLKAAGVKLPDMIQVDKLASKNVHGWSDDNDAEIGSRVTINPNSWFWQDPEGNAKKLHERGVFSTDDPSHVVTHEVGHSLHRRQYPRPGYDSMLVNHRFEGAEQRAAIEKEVGKYATTNGHEFVAEVFAGMVAGKTYSPTVMRAYKELHGPEVGRGDPVAESKAFPLPWLPDAPWLVNKARDASGHEHAADGRFGLRAGAHEAKRAVPHELRRDPDAVARTLAVRATAVPHAIRQKVSAFVRARYDKLAARYGPTGAKAILGATILLLPTPVPGSSLVPVALAEVVLRLRRMAAKAGGDALDDETIRKEAEALLAELMEHMGADGESKAVHPLVPWVVDKAGSFSGVVFGRYYLHGEEVDAATYNAGKDRSVPRDPKVPDEPNQKLRGHQIKQAAHKFTSNVDHYHREVRAGKMTADEAATALMNMHTRYETAVRPFVAQQFERIKRAVLDQYGDEPAVRKAVADFEAKMKKALESHIEAADERSVDLHHEGDEKAKRAKRDATRTQHYETAHMLQVLTMDGYKILSRWVEDDLEREDGKGKAIHPLVPWVLDKAAPFRESDHPRGQPENAGEFTSGGAGGSTSGSVAGSSPKRYTTDEPPSSKPKPAERAAHDWTDYKPPGRYLGDTDEEFSAWQKEVDAHNGKVGATIDHWVENGLEWHAPEDVRAAYADSLRRVFTNIGQHMTTAAMKAVRYVRFHESPQAMTRLFASGAQLKEGEAVGGVWQQDQKGGTGTLNIDGGFKGGPAMPELHAHEIGHAIDSDGRYSRKVAWRNAWKEEIDRDDNPLSEYARTHPEEGFAEYIRLVASGKTAFVQFKKCFQFLKAEGLL